MAKVGYLSKMHEKYYARGFRVVAISDESTKELTEKLVDKMQARYWIGSDPPNGSMENFTRQGDLGIPQYYLVDFRGRVVSDEIPSEEELKKLLGEIFTVGLERELHARLARARLAYEGGAYGLAWKSAGKLLGDEDATLVADARYLRQKVEKYAALHKRDAEMDLKDLRPSERYGCLLEMRHAFAGFSAFDLKSWVDAKIKDVLEDPKIKRDRKAWARYEKALARELNSLGKAYELKRSRELYADVVKKFGGSGAARHAEARIERLKPAK